MVETDGKTLYLATNASLRTWLMTGSRRTPSDRRRVRGSHKGLKKMLVEGMQTGGEQPYSWKEFSDAMVRQSVGEALRALPSQEAQMVKLAYFGGLSNQQIASRFGSTESTVQRRLRWALAQISAHVERGRSAGRRVVYAFGVWLSGRWLGDAWHHMAQAGLVLGAAAVIASQTATPPVHAGAPTRQITTRASAPAPAAIAVSAPAQSSSPGTVATLPVRAAHLHVGSLPVLGGIAVILPQVRVQVEVPAANAASVTLKLPA